MNYSYKDLSGVLIFSVMIACFMGCGSNKSNNRTFEGLAKEEKQIIPGENGSTPMEISSMHMEGEFSITKPNTTGSVNIKEKTLMLRG